MRQDPQTQPTQTRPVLTDRELLVFALGAVTAMEKSDDIGDALKELREMLEDRVRKADL